MVDNQPRRDGKSALHLAQLLQPELEAYLEKMGCRDSSKIPAHLRFRVIVEEIGAQDRHPSRRSWPSHLLFEDSLDVPHLRPESDSQARDRLTRTLEDFNANEVVQERGPSVQKAKIAKRRKLTGGLRLHSAAETTARQLNGTDRYLPLRKKDADIGQHSLVPSSIEKFLSGVWARIYGDEHFDPLELASHWQQHPLRQIDNRLTTTCAASEFRQMNLFCRNITSASRYSRIFAIVVQSKWVECFKQRAQELAEDGSGLSSGMKAATAEACQDFEWTEKELRNKMAVWKGYHELQENGGWPLLVFSGPGIYRLCKYRVDFNASTMAALRHIQQRLEVAADTLQPNWRQLLSLIGEPSERRFVGHPHDWVVPHAAFRSKNSSHVRSKENPIPLVQTYVNRLPDFSYQQIDQCIIDHCIWGNEDPRRCNIEPSVGGVFSCRICHEVQSNDQQTNRCRCFPDLVGDKHKPAPVQVFSTRTGKNNGLLACCPIARGSMVGEFVGLVTAGLQDTDVMEGDVDGRRYQIWQGNQGNFTRFVNHSCDPNSQFVKFFWLGIEKTLLVSKGVQGDEEITADYSKQYWKDLEKQCLCGSGRCRYRDRTIAAEVPT